MYIRSLPSPTNFEWWSHHSDDYAKDLWTHCSVYEVWDNITQEQVEELEGLFRHIYRKDIAANQLNAQKAYKPLVLLEEQTRKNAA